MMKVFFSNPNALCKEKGRSECISQLLHQYLVHCIIDISYVYAENSLWKKLVTEVVHLTLVFFMLPCEQEENPSVEGALGFFKSK